MSVTSVGPPHEQDEGGRPLGVTLIALLFGISGPVLVIAGFAIGGELTHVDVELHAAVELLLFVFPFIIIGYGILSFLAAIWLWQGKSTGVMAGIAVLGLSLLGEFLLYSAVFATELTFDDIGFGGLPDILRIVLTMGLLVYLWRLDSDFIKKHRLFDVPEYVS